jgi:microcystin-dependent protein
MMASVAKYRDDISGAIVTGGTSTAYTVTSYQVFDTLAHLDGAMIAFTPHTTSAGSASSQITLNVDGLGAKPIRFALSLEIPSGTLVQGTPYVVNYNNSDGTFYLQGLGSGNPYNIPLGGMLEFTGTAAPNNSFVLPFGQAISRTTYATYFALVGTTYGAGDGSTTFNVIDKRGKASFGKDDMGGSAANLITNAGSGIVGTTLGASGGAQTVNKTIAQNQLPNVTLSVTGTVSAANSTSGMSHTYSSGDLGIPAGTLGTINLASGVTSSINGGVTQQQVNVITMPPAIIVNYILRVI